MPENKKKLLKMFKQNTGGKTVYEPKPVNNQPVPYQVSRTLNYAFH